ncbi:hypothetical protein [Rosistilla oblonga]|uniref:hypothetical protein n=1 Tax=Rosistilla oblonga TaxID=2527990 RepID=UPI003A96FD98
MQWKGFKPYSFRGIVTLQFDIDGITHENRFPCNTQRNNMNSVRWRCPAEIGQTMRILQWVLIGTYLPSAIAFGQALSVGAANSSGVTTRIVPLYYAQDVAEVMSLVRGHLPEKVVPQVDPSFAALQQLSAERQKLLARREMLSSDATSGSNIQEPLASALGIRNAADPKDAELHRIDQSLAQISANEQAIRAEAFRRGNESPVTTNNQMSEPSANSSDITQQVQIGVAGQGRLHLRGPLEGVNAITRMLHKLDQPVGQVKIGIHVLQLDGSNDEDIEDMHIAINEVLYHARFMARESQQLFHLAFRTVVSQIHAENPNSFAEAFFFDSCISNFRELHNANKGEISVEAFDSRDIVSTLFFVAIAKAHVRQKVLAEFHRLVANAFPRFHERYRMTMLASVPKNQSARGFRIPGFTSSEPDTPAIEVHEADFSFSRITSYLQSLGRDDAAANSVQVALVRFQRASIALQTTGAAIAKMRDHRVLFQASQTRDGSTTTAHPISGEVMSIAAFCQLTDRVIHEREKKYLDLQESLRGEVAMLDGHLRSLAEAFEEDVRRQFYEPVLGDLRGASHGWKVQMGQLQTTTIVTNDRQRARVSPEQVAVLDQPKRAILLQEGLEVANGLAQEARGVGLSIAAQGASETLVPGSSGLLSAAGVTQAPGKHLEALTTQTSRRTVAVGDEIDLTPVIQPDGTSVAFHLLYTHSPRVESSDEDASSTSGIRRHYVESQVHAQSHDFSEVSRFRVAIRSKQQGNGVALMENIPLVGGLFRPRESLVTTSQENIIFADVVIYPTSRSLGDSWLAFKDSGPVNQRNEHPAGVPDSQDVNLVHWVERTLKQHAESTLFVPTETAPTLLASPPSSYAPPSASNGFRR